LVPRNLLPYLLSLAAVALCIALVRGVDDVCQKPNASANAKARSEKPPSNAEPALRSSAIGDSLKRIAEAQEALVSAAKPYEEQEREQKDLEAQQQMACWARMMFYATAFGALVAVIAAGLLLATLRLARTSSEKELRAYIMVMKGEVSWPAENRRWPNCMTVQVDIQNCGSTPARKMTNWITTAMADGEPTFKKPDEKDRRRSVGVLAPGQGNHFEFERTFSMEFADEIKELRDGRYSFYVWGEISYKDAFGVDRRTSFRYVMRKERIYDEGGKLSACVEGNDYT
jgi:hypothetical protein